MKPAISIGLYTGKQKLRFNYKLKTLSLITICLLAFCQFSFSQYFYANPYPWQQSVLFSRSSIGGTARTAGSADAYGSVGADLGSIDINPAGLGLYRSTDFSVTPALKTFANESKYDGSTTNATGVKPYLSQIGMSWTKILKSGNGLTYDKPQLRSITFAINYQNQNFYNRVQNFGAYNSSHSMIDNYIGDYTAGQTALDNTTAELYFAGQLGLLYYNSNSGSFQSKVRAPVYQSGSVESIGSRNKIDFALGGNISDKVYFGVDVAIPFINATTKTSFGETTASPSGTDSITGFQDYNMVSELTQTGIGFTGSIGLIYRPVKWLRLGASYHLPSWYSINENYSLLVTADFDTAFGMGIQWPPPPTSYTFRSPMSGVLSASFYLGEHGFISVDYELKNLGGARFNYGAGQEQSTAIINHFIDTSYAINHNIRVGIEGTIKVLRLRAGYSFSSSPYKKGMVPSVGYNEAVQNATAGIGVRLKHFYADFAYVFGFTKDVSYPFDVDGYKNAYFTHNFLLTIGWKLNSSEGNNNRKKQTNYAPPQVDDDRRY